MKTAPHPHWLLLRTLGLTLLWLAAAAARADEPAPPHWSYSGSTGPAHWGSEDAAYATCGLGQRQSPINIENAERADLPAIDFAYKPVPLIVTDTGHSMQVNVPAGSGGITVGKDHYDLVQFHFHMPSEEAVRGKRYPLVVHLVHKDAAGHLAVLAVLFRSGKGNAVLQQVFGDFPPSGEKERAKAGVTLDPMLLLPPVRGYYTFEGSLTTPPCSEAVRWFVLKRPMQALRGQIALFATRYPDNARPIQPGNGRHIEQTAN